MQFLLLVYNDAELLDALPAGRFDTMMKGCLEHADELQREGAVRVEVARALPIG